MSYTSFTTEDLWILISNCGPKPSIKDFTSAICLHLHVKPNDTLITVVTDELRRHTKAAKKMKERHSRDRTVLTPVTSVNLFDNGDLNATTDCNYNVPMDVDDTAECTSSGYKSRRSFGSLQPKQ